MKKIWETNSYEETEGLGEALGQEATAGQVYCLDGDLGVGKTVFSKGFAKGLGITEHVTSPTFTIINMYQGRLPLYHFDVYRISSEEDMEETGYEEYFYGTGVSLVEWGNLIPSLLPKETIYLTIEKDPAKGENYRRIILCQGAEV